MCRCTLIICISLITACSSEKGNNYNSQPIDITCTDLRTTSYTASNGGWCEFDRTIPVLPSFVLNGLTTAIAEPWAGGSRNGAFGESCGECWEVSTIYGKEIVMVHDLCPVEGNPICAGSHFHFDLSTESAESLGVGGLDAAVARSVPCPVNGNIHVQINDWNEWGYIRVAFINHAMGIRRAEIMLESTQTWVDLERSGGAWHLTGGPDPQSTDLAYFRLTSVTGEIIQGDMGILWLDDSSNYFDTGAQFVQLPDISEELCEFVPPADIYIDEWGGIDQVRWVPLGWNDLPVEEAVLGCQSGKCLKIDGMRQWGGMHFYYRREFPPTTFNNFSFSIRSVSGSGTFIFHLTGEEGECTSHEIAVTEQWQEFTTDVLADCNGISWINMVTFQNTGSEQNFLMDNIMFSR
ncbi:hypothetical protein KKF34_05910 [Myxococcota bacterium]|nr:hypothetical protein [Myxococcota bacterium]MBU1381765.1 hypothetical protein [Myxococcota bacterium]MBU1496396.1 hypothetical protein [Myxococcota bacterium]